MVSQRQLEANRANAKRSTGPKSASGKARSRLNAVTHGLTARQLVVGAEKPEDFDALREALFADLEPSGALQCELVDEIARLTWRLRRIPVLEADLLNRLTIRPDDLWNLNEEELDQFETLYRKLIVNPQERRLSVAVDDEGSDGKPERMPRRIETLSILSRIEASLLAGRSRTLSLLLGIRPPGPLPGPMLGPFERRQPTVGFLHRNDEFVAKGSSFRLRLRPDLPRIPACLTPYVSLDFSGRRE